MINKKNYDPIFRENKTKTENESVSTGFLLLFWHV
jgi:hypothetical protein